MDKKISPADVAHLAIQILKLQAYTFSAESFFEHFRLAAQTSINCLKFSEYLLEKSYEQNDRSHIKKISDIPPFVSQ